MDKHKKDMDVLDFARSISMLPTDTQISNEFDRVYGQKDGRWWGCQREHLTVWCLFCPTSGTKGYKHKPSNSARRMYYNFGRPETLLWLAESLGEDGNVLREIVNEIKEINNCKTACSKITQKISFDRILELLEVTN